MKKILFTVLSIISSSVFANPSVINQSAVAPEVKQIEISNQSTYTHNLPILSNKEAVPVLVPDTKKEVEPAESKTFNEVQGYSAQTTEEYIKRRNATFNTGLNECINKIPKNAYGKREPEAMLKCAN